MSIKSLIFTAAVLMTALTSRGLGTDRPAAPRDERAAAAIEELIAQLGNDEFTKRREAEAELIELGAAAFDHLQAAQTHPDLEIATQSQYLLYRVPIDWVRSDDPQEVRELMINYGGVNTGERREIIKQLAALEDAKGLAALARIAHFDMSTATAKYAALRVLDGFVSHCADPDSAADTIAQEIGSSPRESARWLRTYTAQLGNLDYVDAAWLDLIAEEMQQLTEDRRGTNTRQTLGLIQFHIKLSSRLDDSDALFAALKNKTDFLVSQASTTDANATRVISRMLDKQDVSVLDGSALRYSRWIDHDMVLQYVLATDREAIFSSLALTLTWAIENQQWDALRKLEEHYAKEITSDRLLQYLVAVSRAMQGHSVEAEHLADAALRFVDADINERNQMADVLAGMGYHDWAEREWRQVVEMVPLASRESMIARRSIANWCLHDRDEDKAAADLLGEVCDAVDASAELKSAVQNDNMRRFYLEALRTQREYFLACHLESEGDYAGQQKHLEAAFRLDPHDPDVLIAMFRLKEADDIYRDRVSARIRRAAESLERRVENNSDEPMLYNHYAWLVSNTEGDYQKALRYSLKSLELCPDTPSYLDTLGRCYYAVGDLKNAIKHQREAVAMHPKVNIMRKQLELFEKEWVEKSE